MSQTSIIVNTPNSPGHSDAQDWASIFNSIMGTKSGVIKGYRNELALSKVNDNVFRLSDGIYSLQGHLVKVDESTTIDLNVDSGTLGAYRKDYIIAEYRRNDDADDVLEFRILKGTSSTGTNPDGPTLEQGNLNEGALVRQEVLFEINLNGTTASITDKRVYVSNMNTLPVLIELSKPTGIQTVYENRLIVIGDIAILRVSGAPITTASGIKTLATVPDAYRPKSAKSCVIACTPTTGQPRLGTLATDGTFAGYTSTRTKAVDVFLVYSLL